MISRGSFRVFIVLAALSFAGVLFTQIIWMNKAYSRKHEEFKRQITLALQEVVVDILKYNNTQSIPPNPVTPLTENYYAVMVNDKIDPAVLDHFIQTELTRFHIREAYAYSIFDCSNKQLVYGGYYKDNLRNQATNTFKFPPFKFDNYYFTIYFPHMELGILSDMGLWIYLSLLVLLILIFFTYSFFVITKQKRLSEIQRDFINNMAHEIRTPLTTIGMSVSGIESNLTQHPEKALIYSGIIKEESAKLKMQLERILGIGEGVKIEKSLVNIDTLVQTVCDRYFVLHNLNKEQLQTNLQCGQLELNVDAFHFAQVVGNLIDNAVKYSLEPKKIEVHTHIEQHHFLLQVIDNGLGIPSKYHKAIFNRFFRVPYGNIHAVKGFGIGLFYVKQMVKAHKGKVYVNSESGKGSTFTIELPLH
jgi:two-component system phosphate regulon sensor histidine kinase PhoR